MCIPVMAVSDNRTHEIGSQTSLQGLGPLEVFFGVEQKHKLGSSAPGDIGHYSGPVVRNSL